MSAIADVASFDMSSLRAEFREKKQSVIETFKSARPTAHAVNDLLPSLSKLVDDMLDKLWHVKELPDSWSLVAVGGYGRGELFPYSDIDVLLLLPDEHAAEAHKERIETFISSCWDIGLEIGSSVRTVQECLEESSKDVTIQTALLESRCLSGNQMLYQQFQMSFQRQMDPRHFLQAKLLEMRQRHQKFEHTPYSLEPNCKESPGGLRDLQVILWLSKAANLGKTWQELEDHGLATHFEIKKIRQHESTLRLVRARLHITARRREDRLIFDLQTPVAESFGFQGTRERRASEALMHRYYWAAKAVTQLHHILRINIEERILGSTDAPMRRIHEQFYDRGGMLEVASDDLYHQDKTAILRTFLVYENTPGIRACQHEHSGLSTMPEN